MIETRGRVTFPVSIDDAADPAARAASAAAAFAELSKEIVSLLDTLAPLVEEAVHADNLRRAALGQMGAYDRRPPRAELLAEVALHRLGALRPHLPMVSRDSAERAAEALTTL